MSKPAQTRPLAALLAAASLIALTAPAQTALAQDASTKSVQVSAQPLNQALVEIGQVFDVQVIAADDLVSGINAPAFSGVFSAEGALENVLDGTGLSFQRRGSTFVIVRAPAEAPLPEEANPEAARDDADNRLPEPSVQSAIIVTAQKREEDVQDVPISLTVFGAEEIVSSNFVTFEDYALRTPNVSFQNNGGAARTLITIRGVGGGNIASGTGTAFGLYADEIILNPTGGLRQNDLSLFDLERIEVLRGPQGTLFGRNTIGGAINLVTRKPNDQFSGRLKAGVERFDTYSVQGHLNVPVTDKLFVQGSGLYRETEGFIENTTNGNGLGSDATGGRVAVRFVPTDALTIDVSAMRNELRYDFQGISEAEFDAGNLETALPFQVDNDVVSDLLSARINYDAGGFDIISLTAFNEFDAQETFDITGLLGPVPAFADFIITQETVSQEIRLQSNTEDARFRWLVGANYATTDDALETIASIGTPDNPIAVAQTQIQTGEAENAAIFANVDFELNEVFTLTVGGRFSWDDYELVSNSGTVSPGSSEAFTPRITLQYEPTENLLYYATISRGYRPGGADRDFLDQNMDDSVTTEYDPETAWNYEIGANASLFDGRLVGRANAFLLDYDDIQAVFFIPPDNLNTITRNGAAAEIWGAEFDVTVFPTDALTFNVNLGLLDTEFTDFADSPLGDLTGNELPYAAPVTFSAMGEYRRPLTRTVEGYIRSEYTYRSDQEGRNDNNPVELQPGYDLFNLRAGVEFSRFDIEVYGENVFDEEYFTNRRPGPIVTVVPGRPAIWGVRGTARF